MNVDPSLATAHKIIQGIVAEEGLPVTVTGLGPFLTSLPTNPLEMVAALSSPAYTVELTVNPGMVMVSRTGRFGLGGDMTRIDYPTEPEAPEFRRQLADILVPVIRRELQRAADDQAADLAEDGPFAPYEATDAIRRID